MKKIYFFLIALFVSLTMNAGEVTEEQALQKAQQFMQGKQFKQKNLRRAPSTANNAYYVFNAENKGGFIIVAGDDRMPDILGYSEHGNFDLSKAPSNVKWLMDYYAKVAKSLKDSNKSGGTRRAPANRAEVQPLIKTTWDQMAPYCNHCPTIEEGYLTPTGCVATAMAQVINFHMWPQTEVKAMAGYTTGEQKIEISALPAKKFNWYNMTDDDIAWLMRYCGQAVLMNYGVGESGASPSSIPYALISYFGFSKSTKLETRSDFSDTDWEETIYNELNLGRPIIYSGFQSGGGSGHSFVVHGYRDGKFMVNWGWSGDCDGYFTLTNLAPNEYMDFSSDQNAVIGIQPAVNNSITATTINVEKAGTLANYISDDDKYSITELVVSGEINGTDLRLIREMAGNNYKGEATDGKLEKLDLSDAIIVKGGEPYVDTDCINWYQKENNLSVPSSKSFSVNNKIGPYLFAGCVSLKYLNIPNNTEEIGTMAFEGTNLKQIFIPKSTTRIDISAFGNYWRELSDVSIDEANPVYTTMGNYNAIIEKATGKLIIAFCSTSEVPEGVKIIGSHAFDGCSTNLGLWPKLPESLTTIEESAMKGCNGKVIFIPKNLISIGKNAIDTYAEMIKVDADNPKYDSRQNCNAIIETATNTLLFGSRLTEIPEGITSISDYAVSGWHIRRIDLPQSLQTIKESALDMGSGLEMVKVHNPEPIEIPQNTFCQVSSTAKLIVPDGSKDKYATAAGWSSFQNISEVSENLPKLVHVATAGSLASLISEEEKYTIESLTLTGQLNAYDFKFIREMSEQAGAGNLSKIDMLDARIVAGGESTNANVEVFKRDDVLGERALWWATRLEQIILPSTLKGIEESAFEGCINLKSLIIPKSVVEIGWASFAYTYKLSSLSVEEGNPIFDSREDCNAIIETATNTMRYGCPTTTFPTSVTAIGKGAFIGQLGLTSITIPDVISSIGDGAFRNCEGLISITIPAGICELTSGLLRGCTKLESIKVSLDNPYFDSRDNCNAIIETATNTLLQGCYTTKIPSTITKIAPNAFGSIENLVSIEIPSSVTEIGEWAFAYSNQLSRVVCHIKKPLVIGNFVFLLDGISDAILYVPYGTKAAYASTPGWDVFGNIIEMEPDDSYLDNAASIAIKDFDKHYAALNGEVKVPISITGEGITPITSIDYTITTGSNSKEYHLDVEPISYMMTAEVLIPFAADATIGEQAKTLKITKVNGVANECAENVSATGTLMTVMKKPKIIPVVEEYTGTWCGWCVKGTVGLKLLNKEFGKDVITIAIHDGTDNEPMILPEYRSVSGTYPSCQINRGEMMDPYFGTNNQAFGIKKEVEAVQRDYALGGIEMEAEWTDDSQTAINIKTTTTFVEDVAESPYQIGYVLLEDGLTGTGDAWAQSNYYAGSSTSDENLKELTSKPSKITDMKYDHVPVAAWEPMTGVTGTIPTTITHDVPMEYTFKADISGNTRIQNKKKLTVVVLLIDKETGKIINANKYAMGGSFIPGDVNGDGLVNVTDIVATVNYIMEKPSDNFNKEAADLNGDGEVNVTDIVMMVSIIMNGDGGSSRRAAATSSHLVINRNNIQLKNAEAYTAAQFDINLSDGQSINNVVLNVSSDHSLYWKMVDANTYRVVVYSMTNAAFRANSDNLFTVFMTGSQNATISNELLIKAENTTGIDAIRTEAEKGNVYDLNGRQVKNPRKGVYIINGRKVVVK